MVASGKIQEFVEPVEVVEEREIVREGGGGGEGVCENL